MTNKDLEMMIKVKEAEVKEAETVIAGLKLLLADAGTEEANTEKSAGRGRKSKKAEVEEVKEDAEQEVEEEAAEDTEEDYESMTATNLYKLCCKRGISSKCKKRDKKTLIAILKEYDVKQAGEEDTDAEDEWEDEEEDTDPYAGKTAKELYNMCKDRKLSAVPKKSADVYAKILKKADEEAKKKTKTKVEVEEEEDDDDWEI